MAVGQQQGADFGGVGHVVGEVECGGPYVDVEFAAVADGDAEAVVVEDFVEADAGLDSAYACAAFLLCVFEGEEVEAGVRGALAVKSGLGFVDLGFEEGAVRREGCEAVAG